MHLMVEILLSREIARILAICPLLDEKKRTSRSSLPFGLAATGLAGFDSTSRSGIPCCEIANSMGKVAWPFEHYWLFGCRGVQVLRRREPCVMKIAICRSENKGWLSRDLKMGESAKRLKRGNSMDSRHTG